MAMTRKHYIKIAQAISDCTNGIVCIDKKTFIDELCIVFKEDNNNFDSTRFIEYIDR